MGAPGSFWRDVSEVIDAACSPEASEGDGRPHRLLTTAALAKMGAVEIRGLRKLKNLICEQQSPLIIIIICAAGSDSTHGRL
jgi:hypothetical protein